MNYINKNGRWYDENNNSWKTKEFAKKYGPTLINCHNCSDCNHCSDCSNCSRCSNCSYCSYCSRCSDCFDGYFFYNKTGKTNLLTRNDLSGKIVEIDGKKYKLVEA
jgi:hypothetical protein